VVLNTCDEVDNATIVSVDTERELLKWTELIVAEKPNIIIGYNIFGFDYEFMFRRSQETYCEREFLSMNADELCANEDKNTGKLSLGNTKVSLASGEYDLWYPVISGFCRLICILILGGTTTYPRINSTTLLVILSATI
jgi:DNA polymerase delta subunit 1